MKTTKHSTAPKKITKALRRKELDIDLSLTMSGNREIPIPQERLIHYGRDLLLMFEENPKMVTVLPWRRKHDLSGELVFFYCKKCPELKKMIKEFEELIGYRIFEKALYREVDGNIATKGMGMYNKDYRKSEKWRNNLKKELTEAATPTTINVITQDFPSSGKVPDRTSPDRIKKETNE